MNTRSELPDLAEGSSPLLRDWLQLAGHIMKDLSGTADWWWESTLREAKCYYEQWKVASHWHESRSVHVCLKPYVNSDF